MGRCAAVVLAGGAGVRVGASRPKQYRMLAGRPVLRHAVDAFARHPRVGTIRVVIGSGHEEDYAAAVAGLALPAPVAGGACRQASARAGLESLAGDPPELVLIHDAARPFVPAAVIDRVVAALADEDAAAPALPVADALKRGGGALPRISGAVDRAGLWRVQTPQGFRFQAILAAHRAWDGADLDDDAAVAEKAGLAAALVAGDEDNFKISAPEDLARAERLAAGDARTGSGFDVHVFRDGGRVVLCGIEIPHDRGLAGHSDADAATHAVVDALLGAVAAGDIGTHFPPSDPRWRGTRSRVFAEFAARLVADKGGWIANVDVTIICDAPRIAPHREEMRRSLAAMLSLDPERVGVKATTTEGLGLPAGDGIAALAAATVRLPWQAA